MLKLLVEFTRNDPSVKEVEVVECYSEVQKSVAKSAAENLHGQILLHIPQYNIKPGFHYPS